MSLRIERVVTQGTFALDGGTWDVDNNIWLVGDDNDVVIVGIRPEQFRDPALLDDDQRRRSVIHRGHVDVIEWLGDEQLLYLPYQAPERIRKQLEELGRELDAEWSRTQVIAKLSGETKLAEGEEVELAFDPREVHVFDPATGTRLAQDPEPHAAR